jgi:hypothetical protein
MRTQADIDAILRDVRAKLDSRKQTGGPDLYIPPDGYSQDDDWLTLLVSPGVPGIQAYQYVQALSELNRELRANGVEHVLLVPAFAD